MEKKICGKCGIEKELNKDNFETRKESKDGFRGVCRECRNRPYEGRGNVKLLEKRPDLEKYLANKEDGYKYSYASNKSISVKCPICGFEKNMIVNDFTRFGFGCNVCSDGVSFGEKVLSSILKQFKVNYKKESTFEWSKKYRYDFYIKDLNIIIEVNGSQHYKEATRGRSLEEEQRNDKLKRELALNNDIEHYIVIDCRKSEIKYIMDSIIHNESFSSLFNVNEIDWKEVLNDSQSEVMNEIIKLYNINKNISNIAKEIHVGREKVRDYLKLANDLGLIEYNCSDRIKIKKDDAYILNKYKLGSTIQEIAKELKCHEDTIRKIIRKMSKVGMCEYNGEFNRKNSKNKMVFDVVNNKEYKSITEASKHTGIPNTTLRRYCNSDKNKEWILI